MKQYLMGLTVVALLIANSLQAGQTYPIKAKDFAWKLDGALNSLKLKMNSYKTQSSYIEFRGIQLGFKIDEIRVDLDCGILCPDFGDALFYVNDVNLRDASYRYVDSPLLPNGFFSLSMSFEDSGREIKGFHNKIGDNAMPDFNMTNIRLNASNALVVLPDGSLTLRFQKPNFTASINSTGGCRPFGFDICDKVIGSNKKIDAAIEKASYNALNSARVQQAMALGLRLMLQQEGITGPFKRVYLHNDYLYLEKR